MSGYLVSSAIATPVYGKLSDLYGRRRLLSVAIAVYLCGSILCAFAQSMPQLVAFRVLQGLGGGGLLALSQATIADIAPGPERGRYQGYLAGMFAIAAVAGPVLGGYLSWYISWRAIFWFTVPIAVSAFLISRRALALLPVPGQRRPIDYAGALLLGIGLAAILIALTRIGQGHGWTASSTLMLVGTGALALFGCALRERVAPEPMLPPELFVNRRVLLCCVLYVLVFFLLVGHSVLLPIWMQALGGAGANDVALRMLPLTLGVPAGAYASGRLVLRLERCRPIIVAGALLAIAGSSLLALVAIDSLFATAFVMLVLGFGMGLTMPASIVELQAAVAPRQVGIATAVGALFRTLGGAIGIAILTSMLFARVRSTMGIVPGEPIGPLHEVAAETLSSGFELAFVGGIVVAVLALGVSLAMPSRLLRYATADDGDGD